MLCTLRLAQQKLITCNHIMLKIVVNIYCAYVLGMHFCYLWLLHYILCFESILKGTIENLTFDADARDLSLQWFILYYHFKLIWNWFSIFCKRFCIQVQGVSENMQQLITSTQILFQPGQINVIHQIKAYNHTFLFIMEI